MFTIVWPVTEIGCLVRYPRIDCCFADWAEYFCQSNFGGIWVKATVAGLSLDS